MYYLKIITDIADGIVVSCTALFYDYTDTL